MLTGERGRFVVRPCQAWSAYRSDAELLHHEVHDRRLDFATFWTSSVRSEEEQKYREGKAICLALTSDAGVILWSERPWVDRIRKVWRFVVL
jgi:hypothetical protein